MKSNTQDGISSGGKGCIYAAFKIDQMKVFPSTGCDSIVKFRHALLASSLFMLPMEAAFFSFQT